MHFMRNRFILQNVRVIAPKPKLGMFCALCENYFYICEKHHEAIVLKLKLALGFSPGDLVFQAGCD